MANILIVDDSSFQRTIIKKILADTDHTYEEAENGAKAIELLTKHNYDLVLLDLLMPDVTGFDVLKSLKSTNQNIPAIVISADIQESVRKECFELGAREFINKPIKKDPVKQTIQKILQ